MKKDVVLTISILISNRPETVEKCLDSLQSLRQKVASELILVDTGCGETVRSIIERYADQIIEFEWCKDFSKARNVGLKAAHGKWFLYLDDDEWFENTEEIEDFFTKGEWEKYGYALYRQRNYSNKEGTIYSDALVGRMVRLDKEIEFKYSIHECFANAKGPTKKFDCYVNHYGYIYNSPKEAYIHSQRNIKPLIVEHKKDIYNLRHNTQLAQEYNGIKEYTRSLEISKEGISDYRESKSNSNYLNALFANVVTCYVKTYEYEEAYSYAKRFLRDSRTNILCVAKLDALMCKICYNLKKYAECLEHTDSYLAAYYKQKSNENDYIKYTTLFLYCFETVDFNTSIGYGIQAAIALEEPGHAEKLFEKINMKQTPLVIEDSMIDSIIDAYIEKDDGETKTYRNMLVCLLENETLKQSIVGKIERKREKNPEIFRGTAQKWRDLNVNHWYFYYIICWSAHIDSHNKEYGEAYNRMWNYPQKVLINSIKLDIWNLSEELRIDNNSILTAIPFYKWKKAVEAVCQIMKWDDLKIINDKIALLDTKSRQRLWWEICYLQRTFKEMDGEEKLPNINNLKENLFCYAESCWKLFQNVYREEMFSEMSDMLPQCCQVSFYLTDLFQQENQHNFVKMVDDLKQIREINGDFAIPVKHYLKYAGEQMAQQQEEQKKTQAELADMAEAVKVKVRQLIALQKYEEAKAIIAQLEQMLPGDPELPELKKQCE